MNNNGALSHSFITIDFEGDASSLKSTFDRDTIPWCFTVARPEGTSITYCTKLKRSLDTIRRDAVSHCDSTKIPHILFGSRPVIEVETPSDLILHAAKIIRRYEMSFNTCIFKSYWDPVTKKSFPYDRELMRICIDRYNIGNLVDRATILQSMLGVHVKRGGMTHSCDQVQRGECVSPDEFLLRGLRHNIADACTLAYNVAHLKTFTDDTNQRNVYGVGRKVQSIVRNEKLHFNTF